MQERENGFSCLKTVHAIQPKCGFCGLCKSVLSLDGDPRLGVENIDLLKRVALADFKIVEVMGRSNLDCARSLFRIGIIIPDNRNQSTNQW